MKKVLIVSLLSLVVIMMYSFTRAEKKSPEGILIPEGYRNWTHVKTAVNNPAFASHSGFHHIYANSKALDGYKTGRFADGAIIVFDVLESLPQKNGDMYEGKRKLIDIMVKNSSRFSETGGWGYEEFTYSDSVTTKALHPTKEQCFNCHNTRKASSFIFSSYRS
ncbi:cytochrome P460 family protein [Mucilaginibacter sp. NFX135]|uniref:cytochrome P460 family protein n=1 Tax=Mucilaginibacter sp. NFX135 TaxID=3402687 RepID=UPI003AFB19A2